MKLFVVLNRHGLRFTIYAQNHNAACREVLRMLRKRHMPDYLSVVQAVA